MYLLGFDVGSSSVKVSLINAKNGEVAASDFQPRQEMKITALKGGWAEQDPESWWLHMKEALKNVLIAAKVNKDEIISIGISYQMHGLVCVDKNQKALRSSIIWCDSRAVEIGERAFNEIGDKKCLGHLLNSPGNFTASKLKWVKENEPELYNKIDKIMLPGDFIAMKLTGKAQTTASGLSEGMLWDFKTGDVADLVLDHYGFDRKMIPEIIPTFSNHGTLTHEAANELGLSVKTIVSYRAGDQPNNALSLNVVKPGEIAATAGTSGVVYGVSSEIKYDPQSRVNTFAHVNHTSSDPRLGVLLCVNGTGILNSWTKTNLAAGIGYEQMNEFAAKVPIGSQGLSIIPFGNGAERILGNKNLGSSINGINFNIHTRSHILRAVQEGIVFSFKYGMDIMKTVGINPSVIRAGNANMFLSPVFRDTLAGISGAIIELYDTDGAKGAALGGGVGAGVYNNIEEAMGNLKKLKIIEPNAKNFAGYTAAYENWMQCLTT